MQVLVSALLAVLLLLVGGVRGSYVVEVRVHSYSNPSGRCDGCRVDGIPVPGCCDERFIRTTSRCPQTNTCDTGIAYCIRSSGQTQECQLNQAVPSELFVSNTNNFNFGDGDDIGLPNPIEEFDVEAWRGITITFVPVDCTSEGFCATIIDRISVDILIPVGTAMPETEYIGNAGLARLNVSFEVRCDEDFYGEDCLTPCLNFDSCDGCGLTGFTGEFCQFGVANCSRRYCNGNGDCVEGEPECDCDTGFAGDFCQENIDDCEDNNCSNDGTCVDGIDSFTCDCPSGFNGSLCQFNINDCEGISCNNNGECVDEIDDFTCNCDSGFTGDRCEANIGDCSDTSCGNGECIESVDSFTCDCEAGFAGNLCNTNINDCVKVNCNSGQCQDEIDDFMCLCDPGFTGDQCQEEIGRASSANVGGIAGGATGGLIVVIIVAIIVVLAVLALSRGRRSNKHAFSEENRSPSGIIPIDNPSYGARNGPNQVQVPGEGVAVIGRTEHLPSTSLQEREFDNPIYSTNTATETVNESADEAVTESNEDRYTEVESRYTEVESRYTVPNSTPRNVYERIDDSSREGEVASGGSGVYYSVVTT